MPNDGIKQSALPAIRPAVIIGAGGVGKEVLMRVRRMIVEHYRSLAHLPIVQFLHVDTHTALDTATSAIVLGEDISFRPDERVELSQKIRERVGTDIEQVRRDPRINRWLYDQLKINYDFATGAGGVRALGRLCFVYSVDVFREKLRKAAETARDPLSVQTTQRMLGFNSGAGLDVYLVCSLFGGTGSGSFLELCYNIREQLEGFGLSLSGFLVIGANKLDPIMRANCYGALKELEHYSSAALDPSLKQFDMEYPVEGVPRLTKRELPFDVCYLTDWRNEAGATFNKAQLEENLARNIFLEFTPGISEVKRGKRIDILGTGGRDKLEEKQGRFQGFFTFGLSILEFPALRIRDCLAYGLAAQAARAWLFEQAPSLQDLPGETGAFLRQNDLLETELINYLLLAGGEDLRKTCAKELRTQREQLAALIERPDFDAAAIVSAAKGHIEHNRALVTFDFDPQKCGDYVTALQERKRSNLAAAVQAVKLLVSKMVGNQFQGSRNALVLLNSLISRLTKQAEQLSGQFAAQQRSVQKAQQQVDQRCEMLKRDASPKYRWQLQYHNEKLYEETQQQFLTLALKREAYRFAYQLLREDLTVNGQLEPCLLTQLENLKARLETYRERLTTMAQQFEETRRDKEENLFRTEIAAGVSLNQERLQALGKQIAPNAEQEGQRLLDDLQNELGEKDAAGNLVKARPLFLALTEQPELVKRLLVQAAQRRYDQTKNHSIAAELAASPQLSSIIRTQLEQATVLATTSGLQDQTAHIPAKNHYRWVGTGKPEEDAALNSVLSQVSSNYEREGVGKLVDKYQLIFAEEKGVFPLRCLPFLRSYEAYYLDLMKDADPIPRETDKRIAFRNLFPEPEGVGKIRLRVEKALLLGQVFRFLCEEEDPVTHYPAIFLSYYDEKARDYGRDNLGRDWQAAEQLLNEKQQAKELRQQNVFDDTPLEILERELEKKGNQARTREMREQLWQELQTYLDGQRAKLDGGDLHPEYQRQRRLLQAFRDRYKLQAPLSVPPPQPPPSPPPPQNDESRQTTPINHNEVLATQPIIQPPPDPAWPTQLISEQEQERAAAFRKKAQAALSGVDAPSEQLSQKLLGIGIKFWKLPLPLAQQVLQEELALQQNQRRRDSAASRESYRELFLLVIETGDITPEERTRLREEQQALGLSAEAVSAIEYPYTARLYRQLLEDALIGGEIDSVTRAVLHDHQLLLNLTDEQARQLESEFSAPTAGGLNG